MPQLGADQTADRAGDDDVGGIVLIETALPQIELDRPTGHEERDHHHQTVAGQLDGPEVQNERVHGHVVISAVSSPGSGRSARASRVQSLRSPSRSRCQAARAIIAALSALRRALGTATRAMPARFSAALAGSARLQVTPTPITA